MKLTNRSMLALCVLLGACSHGHRHRSEVSYSAEPVTAAAPQMPGEAGRSGAAPAAPPQMPGEAGRYGVPPAAPSQMPGEAGRSGAAPASDLGRHTRAISTKSAEAQRAFDRGLVWNFAFNHDEAIRHYEQAAAHDPSAAMPHWGIAFAHGPHINNPAMPPERVKAAWAAIGKAVSLSGPHSGASAVERDLIAALSTRYSADEKAERHPLDVAYANAMRAVWRAHPDDADVGALTAEALMDLHPWDLWTIDGKPKEGAEEIVSVLETVLKRWPDHPLANHLYIHAVEASPDPARAVPAADRLATLVPGAGHMVHMPAHIYIRVGRFADASKANELAIEVDERNSTTVPAAGFYRMYMAHNRHFLAFACMMEGRSAAALEAARQMIARIPREAIEQQPAVFDGFMPSVLHVFVRFGRWEAILEEPDFPESLSAARAIRHYARGIAFAALGRVAEAEKEQQALAEAVKRVPADRTIGQNKASLVLGVPVHMLAAEIAFRKGNQDQSFAEFREAIKIEDTLIYDEPPDWMQPVRHAFGATLVTAKRFDLAEQVFREDLKRFPGNGWSLTGLRDCLRARGAPEAADVAKQVEKAFEKADMKIASACLCQPGGN